MATSVPADKTITLKDEEYVELGKAAAEEVLRLSSDMDNWLPTNHSDEQCQIYTRGSLIKGAAENMLMLQTTIDAPVEKLYEILAPWKEYRMKWDDMLEDVSIITSLPEEAYVIRHLVRKRITLSPRESIDVVKVLRKEDGTVVFGATGSSHAAYPPTKGYVRTHQYIGGYILKPIDANNTALIMVFHADLNLPGPKLFSSFADKFKPKLMIENARNLREAAKKFNC